MLGGGGIHHKGFACHDTVAITSLPRVSHCHMRWRVRARENDGGPLTDAQERALAAAEDARLAAAHAEIIAMWDDAPAGAPSAAPPRDGKKGKRKSKGQKKKERQKRKKDAQRRRQEEQDDDSQIVSGSGVSSPTQVCVCV